MRRLIWLVCLTAVATSFSSLGLHAGEKLVLVAGGGNGPDGGPAIGAAMGQPFGAAIDQAGNLYLADYTDHRVRKITPDGIITTLGGTGKKGFSGDGGPANEAQFSEMHDLVLGENGDVYVADSRNLRVRKIDAKTGIISTVAGNGEKKVAGDGGPGDKASLDGVASLFFDPTRTKLYMTGFSTVVRVLDVQTGVIDTVKNLPGGRSVAVDSKGNIYIGGGKKFWVQRPDGAVETLIDAREARPGELTVGDNTKHLGFDADENVFLSDDFGHAIKKYLVAEKKLIRVVGTGVKGTDGLDGPPDQAQLNAPHGVYFHPATKTLYVCDSRNSRVLKVVE